MVLWARKIHKIMNTKYPRMLTNLIRWIWTEFNQMEGALVPFSRENTNCNLICENQFYFVDNSYNYDFRSYSIATDNVRILINICRSIPIITGWIRPKFYFIWILMYWFHNQQSIVIILSLYSNVIMFYAISLFFRDNNNWLGMFVITS